MTTRVPLLQNYVGPFVPALNPPIFFPHRGLSLQNPFPLNAMAASPLTPKKWALLGILTVSTFILWKLGAPSPQPSAGTPSGDSTNTSASLSSASKSDSKQCCDKAINRSAFLKQAAAKAAPDASTPRPPANSEAPASSTTTPTPPTQ